MTALDPPKLQSVTIVYPRDLGCHVNPVTAMTNAYL